MTIMAKKPENDSFEIIPEGTHKAVCYGVWDIGIQSSMWNGEEKRQHKVVISWEIDKKIKTEGQYKGKRYVISNKYTLSLSDRAKLKAHLESWRGRKFTPEELNGFDIEKLIGANCLLNIVHNKKNDRTYANIAAVIKLTKGTEKMKPENGPEPPEWVQKLQSEGLQAPEPKEESDPDFPEFDEDNMEDNDDIPF